MLREPKLKEMAPSGDNCRYLWVMEPTLGRIFGCAFTVSMTEECAYPGTAIRRKLEAYNEMLNRLGRDEYAMPEGSLWEDFLGPRISLWSRFVRRVTTFFGHERKQDARS